MQRWARAAIALLALGLAVNGAGTCCAAVAAPAAPCCPGSDQDAAAGSLQAAPAACCVAMAPKAPAASPLPVRHDASQMPLPSAALLEARWAPSPTTGPARAPALAPNSSSPRNTILRI